MITYNCSVVQLGAGKTIKGITLGNDGFVYLSFEHRGLWKIKPSDKNCKLRSVVSAKHVPTICLDGITCYQDTIFMCDKSHSPKILQYNTRTKIFSGLVGTGHKGHQDGRFNEATFNFPTAITADSSGNLIIVDEDRIRRINMKQYTVETITDNRFDPFSSGISGVVCVGSCIYITARGDHCIRMIQNGEVSVIAGTLGKRSVINGEALKIACFGSPDAVCRDLNGNLLIIDDQLQCFRKLSLIHNTVTSVEISSTHFKASKWFTSIACDKNGNIYIGAPSKEGCSLLVLEPSWEIEKLLWIAFLKEDSSNCLLAKLPKDLIKEIIVCMFPAKVKYNE